VYDLIKHEMKISDEVAYSSEISLNVDQRITGAINGIWKYDETSKYITFCIDKKIYKGVVSHQYNETISKYVITISVLHQDLGVLWASKK
jgi:hypothetical protein